LKEHAKTRRTPFGGKNLTEKGKLGDKSLIRLAGLIYEQYEPSPKASDKELLTLSFSVQAEQLQELETRRKFCLERGWRVAEADVRSQMQDALNDFKYELETQIEKLKAERFSALSVVEIYRDLKALQQEFGGLEYCPKLKELSVVTEPIELEELYLGAFSIRLNIAELSAVEVANYDVVALEPYPPRSNSDVTHPHVRDNALCAGEAWEAIRVALRQGRLLDFFTLVNGVLNTYNDGSPYVRINDWGNIRCSDCDDSLDADDGYICDLCEGNVCSYCHSFCQECEETRCQSCSRDCLICQDSICEACQCYCSSCSRTVCKSCFTSNERCKNCHERLLQTARPDDSQSPTEGAAETGQTGPEIQPVCVGEAAVSA
jgi:hypothetical protein